MTGVVTSQLSEMRITVRRLTASPSSSQLTDDQIDQYINASYCQDMSADVKNEFFKDVVKVFTEPNQDRYALSGNVNTTSSPNVNTSGNTYEAIREPVYVEGRRAKLYKDRGEFYASWPRTANLDDSLVGDGATVAFSLTLNSPCLQFETVIGTQVGGQQLMLEDGGDGVIYDVKDSTKIYGTINYKTGALALTFLTAPDADATITVWYYNYSAGRPSAALYWKNELILRPVPDKTYKIELEAYKYPDQFTSGSDTPILKQWWQYLSLLAAVKVLRDRQDMEGIENLAPMLERQERLIRNHSANNEIGMRNTTIYEGSGGGNQFPFSSGGF